MAGLVKDDDEVEAERLRFVTEAEASAYFGLHYSVEATEPALALRETTVPACVQAGGIFPTQVAKQLLRTKLHNSLFLEDLDTMVSQFDVKTKCIFSDPTQSSVVKAASATTIARWAFLEAD